MTNDIINKSFFEPVAFKPNSIRQEDVSDKIGIERVLQSEINKNQEYLALIPVPRSAGSISSKSSTTR